jgi:predicted metal-dependent peptidase
MAKKQVTDEEAINALVKSRANLVLDHPFFGALALRLESIVDRAAPTAWTNGQYLAINPDWFMGLSLSKRKGLLAHEIMHNALAHPFRRGTREPRKWNKACDYVINAILLDSGFELPDDGLIDSKYKDWSAEKVYDSLPDDPGNGKGGNNSGSSDPGGCGEVRDASSNSGDNGSAPTEEDWQQAVVQAAQAAKMQGNLPGFAARLIGDLLRPKIDWRDVLQAFLDPTARDDYSWNKRNRRHQDIYLPSLRSEQVGDVVVVVDTSGSIGGEELKRFNSELKAIMDYAKPKKIYVMDVDAKLHSVREFEPQDFDIGPLKFKGGGGTDFKPAYNYIAKEGISPECLIYFTDLCCDSYPKEPDYETFWVCTVTGAKPKFGQVFYTEDAQ